MTGDRGGKPGLGAEDRDGPVGVRTQHPGALGPECRDGAGRRMAVRVIGAAGNQRQARRQPVYQRRVLIGGAMVCHLQDIDTAELGVCREQPSLCGRFEITEQQDGQPSRTDEQGNAGVVGAVEGVGPGGTTRTAGASGASGAAGASGVVGTAGTAGTGFLTVGVGEGGGVVRVG